MSFELPTHRKQVAQRGRWPGAAFLVEAMLLLVFVMASLAVLTQMFALSSQRADESRMLTDAVAVASASAERFAANPAGMPSKFEEKGLTVVCKVVPDIRDGGVLYHADISVFAQDVPTDFEGQRTPGGDVFSDVDVVDPVYTIQTSKYESGV